MRLLRTVSTVILSALAVSAVADDYPNKAIRLIMPYPIGGSIDIAGRMVAQRLADNLGQAVVVDNRTGAGGIVGTETGARAAPDGYTVLMGGTGTLALSPSLQKNLPYDPNKDFTPVTLLVTIPYVVVVHPSFKAANIKGRVRFRIAQSLRVFKAVLEGQAFKLHA
jgi:tripartite-type tricarboxylate transporter receptor subunit TctC